jgi:hypothetical protein
MSISNRILLAIISLMMVFAFNRCYKEHDTVASVTLLRAFDSTKVEGAQLRLYYDGSDRIDTIITTRSNGIADVDFTEKFKAGQTGFAVLDIDLVIGDSVIEPQIGIIKVEQEQLSKQTVFCTKC